MLHYRYVGCITYIIYDTLRYVTVTLLLLTDIEGYAQHYIVLYSIT